MELSRPVKEVYIREEMNDSLVPKSYRSRLKSFYDYWGKFNGSINALLVKTDEEIAFRIPNLFHCWLFGCEFPGTSLLFMNDVIYCFCSKNHKKVLQILTTYTMQSVSAKLVFVIENHKEAVELINPPTIGYIEEQGGVFLDMLFKKKIESGAMEIIDVSANFCRVFDKKDDDEIENVNYAAKLSAFCIKNFVVPKLSDIIKTKTTITHSSLASEYSLKEDELPFDVRTECIEVCSPLVFQSGEEIDITPGASNNDQQICYEDGSVILCSCGYSYKGYGSYVARTFLINGTEFQKKVFQALLEAQKAVIQALEVDGRYQLNNKMSDVYRKARFAVEQVHPDLCPYLTESVGVGIGLRFRDFGLKLDDQNLTQVSKGMVFDVSVGFKDVIEGDKKFSMLLGDTVVSNIPVERLTNISRKINLASPGR